MWNNLCGSPLCNMDGYGGMGRTPSPMQHEMEQFRNAYPSTSSTPVQDHGTYGRRCTSQRHHEETHLGPTYSGRCFPQSPPHFRRPLLNFPPPPAYPPPHPAREDCCLVHKPSLAQRNSLDLPGVPGPSGLRPHHHQQSSSSWRSDDEDFHPNDYSYAYYEPGPPTRHLNVPTKHPITGGCRGRTHKHTYLTRYGTEENIYEEISEVARARMRPGYQQHSVISLHQSIVEEEVRRVHSKHKKTLGELNLSVEAMLMPTNSSQEDDTDKEHDDRLTDLLTVGPTDELLSPAPLQDLDSGFSGSSSGASYHSGVGSLRRGPAKKQQQHNVTFGASNKTDTLDRISVKTNETQSGSGGKSGFWSRKGWRKFGALGGLVGSKDSKNGECLIV